MGAAVARRFTIVALACTVIALTGCVHRVERREWLPRQVASIDRTSPFLKAHARDGTAFVFTQWSYDSVARVIAGQGAQLGINRDTLHAGALSVPLDSVSLFETNVVSNHPAVAALAVISGISAVLTIVCITNPKTCFGSCPTFYAWDGERQVLMAEGFSASVSPSLEATDLDALFRAHPRGRDFELHMRNEALETHVVRSAEVLAVPRPADGRVFADGDGTFWQAHEPVAPRAARAAEGDCLAALRGFDGIERFSLADSTDLATRETIDVEFADGPAGNYGLVVGMRQTLMSTYLFYQALAYLGHQAGEWLAALERSHSRSRTSGIGGALGGIEVLVPEGPDWKRVGEIKETGPLASDVRLVVLPTSATSPGRVRLRMTRGAWRLDWVGLVRLEGRAEPVRLQPERVTRGTVVDEAARQRLLDPAQALVTLPGDDYTLAYRLPDDPARYELFLASRGYYLEWMRDEWVAEEDPARAAMMFIDPRKALRTMAPEFKRGEAQMEAMFWGSRFATP